MNTINNTMQLFLNSQIKSYNKISKICQPLKDYFNISTFIFYWLDEKGNYAHLSNNQAYWEYYLSHSLYKTNPFIVHPNLLRSGYVFAPKTPSSEWLEDLASTKKFQFCDPFLILNHQGNYYEGFVFASAKSNDNNINLYLNNLDVLKKFTRYFKEETKEIIEKMKFDHFSIIELMGPLFFNRRDSYPLSVSQNRPVETFLKTISPLSPRERECLSLFQQGYSAQATGAILNISRRTVEYYFEKIKNKLSCNSKWDLLRK